MKILYGVVGEGMGHATRSHPILHHLNKSHEVHIVTSARGYDYLSRFFDNVTEIEGYEFHIEDNVLDRKATIKNFFRSLPEKTAKNVVSFFESVTSYSPDVILSDFESFSYTVGKFHDTPIISIDNMQIIDRCNIEIPTKYLEDFLIAKTLVKNKLSGCYHYLISTFFFPEIQKENTSLYPPIVRDEILKIRPTDDGHFLVYQTSTSNKSLIKILKDIDYPFIVYGYKKAERVGNIEFKKFSKRGFIDDLSGARGVIANSGFSLIGEALYLKKPYFAIPVKNQFEQVLNGIYLTKLGFGTSYNRFGKKKILDFINELDKYNENLSKFKHDGNKKILKKVDKLLAEISS
jgi:uncharacterized protein (TIGR00661 family)